MSRVLKTRVFKTLVLLGVFVLLASAFAQTEVIVFVGSRQNPELIGSLLDDFNAANPDIMARAEIGGTTSEVQQQYLNTVLTSGSADIDIFLIDVVRPATYAAAGWAEPLNGYFENEDAMMSFLDQFLPGPVDADVVDGTLYALPSYTDAQFLYYRADLLEKYGFEPPATWDELVAQAQTILEGENDDTLQGFNYQGAAIEGANCTFLQPLWSAGGDWRDADGNITVDSDEGRQALNFLLSTMDVGVTKPNIAETATDNSRQEFQAGDVVFMLNWGYAWGRFQNDEDSQVTDMVGVAPLPAFDGFESATCIGGWQWTMNAFSDNKDEAWQVMEYLASEDVQRVLAAQDSRIPARISLYEDPDVLAAAPHFGEFYDVIIAARPRPVTPFYDQVSELIRTTVNAVLARSIDVDTALEDMQIGLEDIFEN
ncbi:MAG: ABC transporter substrate-binding protein [Deinococcota bacterium]